MIVPSDVSGFSKWVLTLSDVDIGRYLAGSYGNDERLMFTKRLKELALLNG